MVHAFLGVVAYVMSLVFGIMFFYILSRKEQLINKFADESLILALNFLFPMGLVMSIMYIGYNSLVTLLVATALTLCCTITACVLFYLKDRRM